MKHFVRKSSISDSKVFVIKKLVEPYFDPTFHFHPEYQLFLVLKGQGMRFIGDSMKPFKEGDLIFTGPNLPHVWRNDNAYFDQNEQGRTAGIVIYFQENFLGDSIRYKEEMEVISSLFEKAKRGIEVFGKTRDKVSKMMQELLEMKGFKSIIQLLEIFNEIATSAEINPITRYGYNPPVNKISTDRMNIVYEHVMKNFSQQIELKEIAELVNMTPTSFSRYFKTHVNKSFSEFLKEVRINHACKLLQEEKLNINHVALECGYNTLSNFNKQFKEVMEQTPFFYRKVYHTLNVETYGNF